MNYRSEYAANYSSIDQKLNQLSYLKKDLSQPRIGNQQENKGRFFLDF